MRKTFAAPVLLAYMSVAAAVPALAGQAGDPIEAIRQVIEQNIGLTSKPLTLAQLQLRLHARVKSSRQVENIHVPGQMDRIVVLEDGNGTEVEAYVPATGPVLIQRITVTTVGRRLPVPLQISRTSSDEVRRILGAGEDKDKGPGGAFALRYWNEEQTASALLWFDPKGRLAGVEWSFSAD